MPPKPLAKALTLAAASASGARLFKTETCLFVSLQRCGAQVIHGNLKEEVSNTLPGLARRFKHFGSNGVGIVQNIAVMDGARAALFLDEVIFGATEEDVAFLFILSQLLDPELGLLEALPVDEVKADDGSAGISVINPAHGFVPLASSSVPDTQGDLSVPDGYLLGPICSTNCILVGRRRVEPVVEVPLHKARLTTILFPQKNHLEVHMTHGSSKVGHRRRCSEGKRLHHESITLITTQMSQFCTVSWKLHPNSFHVSSPISGLPVGQFGLETFI